MSFRNFVSLVTLGCILNIGCTLAKEKPLADKLKDPHQGIIALVCATPKNADVPEPVEYDFHELALDKTNGYCTPVRYSPNVQRITGGNIESVTLRTFNEKGEVVVTSVPENKNAGDYRFHLIDFGQGMPTVNAHPGDATKLLPTQ